MTSSLMEKTVLKKIDQLIEIIIDLSSNSQKADLRGQALKKIEELIPLILHFIEGNKSLIQPMLYQLIMEKMPDPRIISSFGNLKEELNSILLDATKEIDMETKNQSAEKLQKEVNTDIGNTPNLQSFIIKTFPNDNVLFNYRFGGDFLDAYLPGLKIAYIIERENHNYIKLNYFCEKQGIKLIVVPKEAEIDYLTFKRINKYKHL
ncbi:MAG: hypothetical protein ACOYVD_05370 [Bacillota bacterium]